ncbi:uncharacterized protein ACA1_063580 [Acanthamoeba castellanii str. Neff]|uniref:Transmembrane protein n=1 Tax=Acanthamoeba castellanii (strain ATCC 30010 / Neff) TaxID=1257118 RepID=L8GWM2_ACACF|nr:uncharacterized protein ACA1_063580 [Acanthamoeba castellanii str. Neff]ELR17594.1 hypothetical protein ACA1_063580 [Acanthamoeba castellanii str. Neff]
MHRDENGSSLRSKLNMTVTAKLFCLMTLTALLFMVWVVECIISLVTVEFVLAIYCACVTGVMLLGFYAAWKHLRPLLFCYIVGVVVVIGFGIVGLTWWLIASVVKWEFDTPWLVAFVFNIFILLIEAITLLLAYLLTKDLDSKHVVTLGSPGDGTSADEQAFSFSQGGSVEVELQPTQHHASVYEPEWPATAYPPDTFGAPSTHSTNGSADDYNPFQEERF